MEKLVLAVLIGMILLCMIVLIVHIQTVYSIITPWNTGNNNVTPSVTVPMELNTYKQSQ